MTDFKHVGVLTDSLISSVVTNQSGCYLDATFGRGGHTSALLLQLTNQASVMAMDQDQDAISVAQELAKTDARIKPLHLNFRRMKEAIEPESLDGIVMDLGVSSPQIDDPMRGFSYRQDGRLDMRMDQTQLLDAFEIVNHYPISALIKLIGRLGEEKLAKRIAGAIIQAREQAPIETTLALSKIIRQAVPFYERHTPPEARTFQAIRMTVNDELGALQEALEASKTCLKVGGRMAVISFHSLESRLVKQWINQHAKINLPTNLPIRESELPLPLLKWVVKKCKPNEAEIKENKRSKSAVLRVFEKQHLNGKD